MRLDEERCVRFYQWAKNVAVQEWENDFARLRHVRYSDAIALPQWLRTLSPEERLRSLLILVKQAHPTACELLGNPMTTGEKEILQHWLRFDGNALHEYSKKIIQPAIVSGSSPAVKNVRQKVFADAADYFGTKPTNKSTGSWAWVRVYGPWHIQTRIMIDRSWGVVRVQYEHRIRTPEGGARSPDDPWFFSGADIADVYRHNFTNFCSWLGMRDAEWGIVTEEATSDSAASVIDLIKLFFDGVTEFLSTSENGYEM